MQGQIWTYDFQKVVSLASIVYGFSAFAPLSAWLLFRYAVEPAMDIIPLFCLFGYALFTYIPAAVCDFYINEMSVS
jgi:hypothetical protein